MTILPTLVYPSLITKSKLIVKINEKKCQDVHMTIIMMAYSVHHLTLLSYLDERKFEKVHHRNNEMNPLLI